LTDVPPNKVTTSVPATTFRVNPDQLVRRLLLVAAVVCGLLLAADYWLNYREVMSVGAMRRLFNATREDSLAGFVGIAQAVLMAATAWGVWILARRVSSSGEPSRRVVGGWLVLALLFTYLAIDDGAMVHERLGTAAEAMAGEETALSGLLAMFPSYTWQVVVGPLLGALGLFMVLFLWHQVPDYRSFLLVAMALVVVAVGLDFIEGLEDEHAWNLYAITAERYPLDDYTRKVFGATGLQTLQHFSRSIEEVLEIFANTLLWAVLLIGLSHQAAEVRLVVPEE